MYEQIRADVIAVLNQIKADFTEYALHIDPPNMSTVDRATQQHPYLEVEIDCLPGGGQMEIGKDNPLIKQRGQIVLDVVVKGAAGTLASVRLADFIVPYFSCKRLGTVQTYAVQGARGREIKGEWHQPFWVDFFVNGFQQ